MGQHLWRFLGGFHHGKCDFPFWAIFTVLLLLKYVYFELTEGLEARYNLVAYSKNTPGGMGQHLRRFLGGFQNGKCDFLKTGLFPCVSLIKYTTAGQF